MATVEIGDEELNRIIREDLKIMLESTEKIWPKDKKLIRALKRVIKLYGGEV